jgi:lipid-binding SYLF domain-containing protein
MQPRFTQLTVLAIVVACLGGCSTVPPTEGGKTDLQSDVQAAIDRAKTVDPTLKKSFDESAGYAVFPNVGKGAAGVGGAYGRGELYEAGKLVGYCDLTQATLGVQLGGQTYTEIIFFETKPALDRFKSGNFTFAAQASAVVLKSGASTNAKYADGVAVFTLAETGLMGEVSIGGQKFSYQTK